MTTVTKRDNSTAQFDAEEIRAAIEFATKDFPNCPPQQLEGSFKLNIADGMTTNQIQEALVLSAVNLISAEIPEWAQVAGRLQMQSRVNQLAAQGVSYQPQQVLLYVERKIKEGLYKNVLKNYSNIQLMNLAKMLKPDRDYLYDIAGVSILEKRYLHDDELLQISYFMDALLLASVETDPTSWVEKFYDAISQKQLSLATPLLANLRIPDSSTSSCFIIEMEDDLESIYQELTNTAMISKNGGGVGCSVSRIRALGSSLMGRKNSSGGVLPWVKLLNDTAIAVNQGGRRAGAVTVALEVWHLDIEEFLECQAENGDQRRMAHDIFPQVVVNDYFIECANKDKDWVLFCPYEFEQAYGVSPVDVWGDGFADLYNDLLLAICEGKYPGRYKTVKAKTLFKKIMKATTETGLPYITNKDAINRDNPNKHMGVIPSTNLCVESFSVTGRINNADPCNSSNVAHENHGKKVAHCCNLVSAVLSNIDTENIIEFERILSLAVRVLDNSIELMTAPFEDAKLHNELFRTIGVGVMGLADWMVKKKLKYRDIQKCSATKSILSVLFETIAYSTTRASVELAKERGSYKAYAGSEWCRGKLLGGKSLEDIKHKSLFPDRWQDLAEDIQTYGIRNSHITAIAPNTSSSIVQGCTPSILPMKDRAVERKWSGGTYIQAAPSKLFWQYEPNIHLDQNNIVELVAIAQQWIDTGISMELVFNADEHAYSDGDKTYRATPKHIFEVLMNAMNKGLKAIYYQRVISSDNPSQNAKPECVSCAN